MQYTEDRPVLSPGRSPHKNKVEIQFLQRRKHTVSSAEDHLVNVLLLLVVRIVRNLQRQMQNPLMLEHVLYAVNIAL
jgi:hypothetical protein